MIVFQVYILLIKFIVLSKLMRTRKYPLLIANKDSSGKGGMHWWSILDINSKSDFLLLDTFRIEGLKNLIIQNDRKIIEKVIKGIEKMDRKDNRLTLVRLKFSIKNFKELKDVSNFFQFVEHFGEYENKKKQKYFDV